MRTTTLPILTLSATLMLAAFSAHADEPPARGTGNAARSSATATAAGSAASSATSTPTSAPSFATAPAAPGLTRAQVLEDLKRYQREHANPSYEELIFLR